MGQLLCRGLVGRVLFGVVNGDSGICPRDDGVRLVYISESDGWLVGTNDQQQRHLETVARMTWIKTHLYYPPPLAPGQSALPNPHQNATNQFSDVTGSTSISENCDRRP